MTSVNLQKLYAKFNGICQLCMKHVRFEDASRDHIIPRSKGGRGLPNNIQLAHRLCNKLKGNELGMPDLEKRQEKNRISRAREQVGKELVWLRSIGHTQAAFIKCPYKFCRHPRTEHNHFGCNLCPCESWVM